ncbi:MAG: hypothetical protein MUE97_08070 [Phycisphaerales bacterium]|nr:hypothetical protein [Phycisphaerales bacterium]
MDLPASSNLSDRLHALRQMHQAMLAGWAQDVLLLRAMGGLSPSMGRMLRTGASAAGDGATAVRNPRRPGRVIRHAA